jgi:hypothetical protein
MASRFYVKAAADAPEKGPFTEDLLKQSIDNKLLGENALVREENGTEWVSVRARQTKKQNERDAMLVQFARKDAVAAERSTATASNRRVLLGAVAIVTGLLLTIVSYRGAEEVGGGRYVVFTGLIVFGIVQVIRGLVR